MNRISQRISESINAAVSAVTCPACRKRVVPTVGTGTPAEQQPEGRWSFIWVAPSGEVCPECQFPLARYARRAKWIRLLFLGITLFTIAVFVFVLQMVSGATGPLSAIVAVFGALGALLLLVGLVGVIVGGRRTSETE